MSTRRRRSELEAGKRSAAITHRSKRRGDGAERLQLRLGEQAGADQRLSGWSELVAELAAVVAQQVV